MKFFLCLFLLDDLLDIAIDSAMIEFLEGLKAGNSTHPNNRLHNLGIELIFLYQLIEDENGDAFAREQWHTAWMEYIEALQWEIRIKINGIPPVLQDYRIMRPKSSGVYLAMLLIRQGKDLRGCISELLDFSLARHICLSNDLASYKKELKIGDPNNELVILMETMGESALTWAQQELKQLRKRILALARQVCTNFTYCEEWIRRLLLLAGGCEAWTAET